MRTTRFDLREWLQSNQVIAALKPVAFVFVLLMPLYDIFYVCTIQRYIFKFHYVFRSFLSVHRVTCSSIFYIIFLAGVILCLLGGVNWALGTAFALRFVYNLIYMVIYPRAGYVLYMLLYAALAVLFFYLTAVNGNETRRRSPYAQDPAQAGRGPTFCNNCGRYLPPTATFCAGCGTPLKPSEPEPAPKKKFCPGCGAPLNGAELFCMKCGRKLK